MEASPSKKAKLDLSDFKLFIIPRHIQKRRYEILVSSARKHNMQLTEGYSDDVTHIVSECADFEEVEGFVEKEYNQSVANDVEVVNMGWFVECQKAGHPVPVVDEYRLAKKKKTPKEEEFELAPYACQRAAPLRHHNEKLTEALEILEEEALYKDADESYVKALAFRRASAVLKSLPWPVKHISQLKSIKDIGQHCKKVIQEILTDGSSSEVEKIKESDWFQKMRIFTKVYGIGPTTANKWIKQGMESIDDVIKSPNVARKDDSRVAMGLAFYDDLNLPVLKVEGCAILKHVQKEADKILPGVIVELAGGFRRGKTQGHDVDILLTHPKEGSEKELLEDLLARLQDQGLILSGVKERNSYSDEMVTGDGKGSNLRSNLDHFEKWLGVMKINRGIRSGKDRSLTAIDLKKDELLGTDLKSQLALARAPRDWVARRVDLIMSPYSQYYYCLVGWTGNKHFNRSLRLYAQRELNMKLTSHALYDLTKGRQLAAKSEEEVFENLKLEYFEPSLRNC